MITNIVYEKLTPVWFLDVPKLGMTVEPRADNKTKSCEDHPFFHSVTETPVTFDAVQLFLPVIDVPIFWYFAHFWVKMRANCLKNKGYPITTKYDL